MKRFLQKLDLPIAELSKIIDEMSWPRAKRIYLAFSPREDYVSDEHDNEVSELLYRRMCRIEQPKFKPNDESRVIRVANKATNDEVKRIVAEQMKDGDAPKFVLENNGKLRGFAVSDSLIIAGVAGEVEEAFEIEIRALEANLQLLSHDDFRVVEKCWADLSAMMAEAKVPDLEIADMFLMATPFDEGRVSYPAWSHDRQRVSQIDWDDCAWLMAKL